MTSSLALKRTGAFFATLALAVFVAACGDSATGPVGGGTFDPESTRQDLETVTSTVDSDEILAGLGLIGNSLGNQLGSPSIVSPALDIAPTVDHLRGFALAGGGSSAPIFPSNLLGVTFVYDETAGDYVPSTRTGAPANGVRFIYYAMNPVTEVPATPLNELGYVDLIDESDAATTSLHVLLVDTSGATPVTYVDYTADGSFTLVGQTLSVNLVATGYLSDGTDRVDFVLTEAASFTEGANSISVTADHRLTSDDGVTVRVTGTASVPTTEGGVLSAQYTASITDPEQNVAVMTLDFTQTSVEGSITYNGVVVIVISGTENSLTFSRPDGTELSEEELTALQEIAQVAEDLFGFAEDILEPMSEVFGSS